MRGHHTNSDPLNLFPFIESRTDKNEEHTKEESRTLCSYSVVIDGIWPKNLYGKFDFVILRHTLEHLMKPTQTLSQIEKCLKPDSLAYIVVPNLITDKFNLNLKLIFLGQFIYITSRKNTLNI